MVLAAGLGTRLRPLTNTVPKPLLPFGDRPLIEHAFVALSSAGLGPDVVVNTHHLSEHFESARAGFSLDVLLSWEPELRGTAGGLAQARAYFDAGPVVVLTSDVVLEQVPEGLRDRANGCGMVLAVAPRPRGAGTVGVGVNGQVVRLRGRSFGEEVAGGEYVGLMAVGEEALSAMPEFGCYIQDYALPLLCRGGHVFTVPYEHGFVIAGDDVPTFFAENLRWLDRERRGTSFVGEGATVPADVTVERSLIGAGARIEGHGTIRRSLVFPGAHGAAPLDESLVTRDLTLRMSSIP